MPKSPNQNLKLFAILDILRSETNENTVLSIYDLKSKLYNKGILAGRDTVSYDLSVLESLGFDIISRREGNKKVYFLGEREFSLPEFKMLIDSVKASKYISKDNTAKLISKLLGLAGKEKTRLPNAVVFLDNSKKCSDNTIIYTVDLVIEAIDKKRYITFNYFDYSPEGKRFRHGKKLYKVAPLGLCCNEDDYYLYAYSDEDEKIKFFRVDRLYSVLVTDEQIISNSIIENFEIEKNRLQTFQMFDGEKQRVTLEVDKEHSSYIYDEFGDKFWLKSSDGGMYIIEVEVQVSRPFFAWCFSFNGGVRIIAPEKVKKAFLAQLDNVRESVSLSGLSDKDNDIIIKNNKGG